MKQTTSDSATSSWRTASLLQARARQHAGARNAAEEPPVSQPRRCDCALSVGGAALWGGGAGPGRSHEARAGAAEQEAGAMRTTSQRRLLGCRCGCGCVVCLLACLPWWQTLCPARRACIVCMRRMRAVVVWTQWTAVRVCVCVTG